MFAQTNIGTASDIQNLQAAGAPGINLPVMNGMVNVVLSSSIPDGYFVAFVKRFAPINIARCSSPSAKLFTASFAYL